MSSDEGRKYDDGKPRWDLLPIDGISPIVDVLTYGAKKYTTPTSPGEENWRKVDEPKRRYYAALLRHMTAWWTGEKIDKESGLPHLAHAGCCLLFLIALEKKDV